MHDPTTARILQFMAPGFLHAMGNSLFAIHTHAQFLTVGDAEQIAKDSATIRTACSEANESLELFRLLAEPAYTERSAALGVLMKTIYRQMRVGLRDLELTLECDPTVLTADDQVPTQTVARAVVHSAAAVVDALTSHGHCQPDKLVFGRTEHGALSLTVHGVVHPLDLTAAAAGATAILAPTGGAATVAEDRNALYLTLPAAAPRGSGREDGGGGSN